MGNTCLNIKINERFKNLNQNIILKKKTNHRREAEEKSNRQATIHYIQNIGICTFKHTYLYIKKYRFYLLLISFYKNLEEKNLK